MEDNRYVRQILAFGTEGQRKIEESRVAIVGLGGMGSHIAQGLAYLGVGSFSLVDDDCYDITSLNRSIGALPVDAEKRTLKVVGAEQMIRRINPKAVVTALPINLRTREAMETLISCPIIFGCVDHDGPRLVLMELAASYDCTLIDSATDIIVDNAELTEIGGRVVVARPGDYCLDCAQQIDMETAKEELQDPKSREIRRMHGYGLGEEAPAPSVVSLNGVVANLAITEFLCMTTGIREPNRHLTYHALRGNVNIRQDKRRDNCYTCGYLAGSRERANIFRYVLSASVG